MPIAYKKTVAVLTDVCTVEEAEELLEWLHAHPGGKVNLKELAHPHTAVLQVLMALRPKISALPRDEAVRAWLAPAIEGWRTVAGEGAGEA